MSPTGNQPVSIPSFEGALITRSHIIVHCTLAFCCVSRGTLSLKSCLQNPSANWFSFRERTCYWFTITVFFSLSICSSFSSCHGASALHWPFILYFILYPSTCTATCRVFQKLTISYEGSRCSRITATQYPLHLKVNHNIFSGDQLVTVTSRESVPITPDVPSFIWMKKH